MNGGVHDAFNLAEKMAAVWHGEGDENLLELYEQQRRPIALEYVNNQTIRNKQNLEAATPEAQVAFRKSLDDALSNEQKTRDYLLRTSMIASLRTAAKVTL